MRQLCNTLGDSYWWVMLPLLVAIAVGSYLAIRFLAVPAARLAIKASPARWDDIFVDRKVLHRLSLFGPALIFRLGLEECVVSGDIQEGLIRFANVILIFGGLWSAGAILKAVDDLYRQLDIARSRPIKGYLQLLLIVLWILATVLVTALTFNESIGFLLAGVGTVTAVLILVFRESILSIVASIQLTQNDLLSVGDEIDVPDLELTGVVQDIALHTVTIMGSDKKNVTIPTHALTSHPFKNWKGIDEAGGRHIRRSICLDMTTIRFLTPDELERFRRFDPIADYMNQKVNDLDQWNNEHEPLPGLEGDPRRLTNIGTFRAYVLEYVRRQPRTETDQLKVMVRQLQPTPQGLPIEIYLYSKPTDLVSYEKVAADLIDHILAMVPEFGLKVHQEPSGFDMRNRWSKELSLP